jgi:hypothetical protein
VGEPQASGVASVNARRIIRPFFIRDLLLSHESRERGLHDVGDDTSAERLHPHTSSLCRDRDRRRR